MPRAIEVVLFDIDGVLIPPSDFTASVRRRYGIGRGQLEEFFGGERWWACMTGEADVVDEIAPYLKRWCWPHSGEEFIAQVLEGTSQWDDEMLGVIDDLRRRGVSCGVASNQESRRGALLAAELEPRFDHVFLSYRVGFRKPLPGFFARVTAELDLAPDAILFWDDRAENVEAARACGWCAERYSSLAAFRETLASYAARLPATRSGSPLPSVYWM